MILFEIALQFRTWPAHQPPAGCWCLLIRQRSAPYFDMEQAGMGDWSDVLAWAEIPRDEMIEGVLSPG